MSESDNKMIGAVLVQGGGIAGVQASLDLANSGFKVYLVERDAAIGGMMAHLDKTFPTGDCATCIVSPKLVECARNLNVEILTLSELTGLAGPTGPFRSDRPAVSAVCGRRPNAPAAVNALKPAPLTYRTSSIAVWAPGKALPSSTPRQRPTSLASSSTVTPPARSSVRPGSTSKATSSSSRKRSISRPSTWSAREIPLSAICGRICTHPCESVCTRGKADEPIAIRLLKRFASDKEIEMLEAGELALPEERIPAPERQKGGRDWRRAGGTDRRRRPRRCRFCSHRAMKR